MIEFFRKLPTVSTGTTVSSQWPLIMRGLNNNLEKTITYYRNNPRPVPSEHLLIRLAISTKVPVTLTTDKFYIGAQDSVYDAAKVNDLTTPISFGKIFKGVFYGSNVTEIIYATKDDFNITLAQKNWKELSPVTVRLHPKSDIEMLLPEGKDYSQEGGLAVIEINVLMLAFQYRCFLIDEYSNRKTAPRNINMFIGAYVLPNMLKSHVELAVFNRIKRKFYNKQDGDNICFKYHPFVLSNYVPHVDDAIYKSIVSVYKCDGSFNRILSILQSPFVSQSEGGFRKSLLMPDIVPTKQIDWALTLARSEYMCFLYDASGAHLHRENEFEIQQTARVLRLYNAVPTLDFMLTNSVEYFKQKEFLERLITEAK